MVKVAIDKSSENVEYVDKDDFEEIQSLIEYLVFAADGCEICHLLHHWKGNVQFRGAMRIQRFLAWISKYPSLFSYWKYRYSWAVMYIGMESQVRIKTKRGINCVTREGCGGTSEAGIVLDKKLSTG